MKKRIFALILMYETAQKEKKIDGNRWYSKKIAKFATIYSLICP